MFRSATSPHAIDMRLATEFDWVTVHLTTDQVRRCNDYARRRNGKSEDDRRKDNHGYDPAAHGRNSEQLHEGSVPSGMALVVYVGDGDDRLMEPWTPIDTFGVIGNVGASAMTPLYTCTRDTSRPENGDKADLRFRPLSGNHHGIYILCDHDPGHNYVVLKGWKLGFECVLCGKAFDARDGRPPCRYVRPGLLYPMVALKSILRELGPNNSGWLVPSDLFPPLLDEPQGFDGVHWSFRLCLAWEDWKRRFCHER